MQNDKLLYSLASLYKEMNKQANQAKTDQDRDAITAKYLDPLVQKAIETPTKTLEGALAKLHMSTYREEIKRDLEEEGELLLKAQAIHVLYELAEVKICKL